MINPKAFSNIQLKSQIEDQKFVAEVKTNEYKGDLNKRQSVLRGPYNGLLRRMDFIMFGFHTC